MPDTQVSVMALAPLALVDILEREGTDSFHINIEQTSTCNKLRLADSSAIDCHLQSTTCLPRPFSITKCLTKIMHRAFTPLQLPFRMPLVVSP